MAIVRKKATIRRVAGTPQTYTYVFEDFPYTGTDASSADIGNTAAQAWNEVGALSVTQAPAGSLGIAQVTVTFEYQVPDVP